MQIVVIDICFGDSLKKKTLNMAKMITENIERVEASAYNTEVSAYNVKVSVCYVK